LGIKDNRNKKYAIVDDVRRGNEETVTIKIH
jgi:hypothetical protein